MGLGHITRLDLMEAMIEYTAGIRDQGLENGKGASFQTFFRTQQGGVQKVIEKPVKKSSIGKNMI